MAILALAAIVFFRPSGAEWTGDVAPAANAPPDHWTTGNKDAIGTAFGRQSNVWFTAVHGTLADVLYPTVDADNLRQMGFLVTDGSSFLFDAATQGVVTSKVTDERALTYELRVSDPARNFTLLTKIATDPDRPVVMVSAQLIGGVDRFAVYAYLVPHLGGSSAGQTAFFDGSRAYVNKKNVWLAIGGDMAGDQRTAGYLGHGDGYDELHRDRLNNRYRQAGPGRVTLTWGLSHNRSVWTTVLAFGTSRAAADAALDATLKRGTQAVFDAYRDGWYTYARGLTLGSGINPMGYHSAEVIKMAEDKLHPGAIVASLALPWGDTATDDTADVGYRKVWPRDLYHAASGLLAAGDVTTARDVFSFMGKQQQADGSMPQNTDLEGRPVWTGQQLDETADAILLAARLGPGVVGPSIFGLADYIATHGPATQQERWEEASGYSPATIAAEIAALRAAARWAQGYGHDDWASSWRATAERWDASLESWTFTHTGPLGPGYYVRVSPDGKPDTAEPIHVANDGGVWDQREIVDPSFLEVVRLGVRKPDDPRILGTLQVTLSQVEARFGGYQLFYRYPHDGYGEKNAGSAPPGQGHLWPLLSGELGVYAFLAGRPGMSLAYRDELVALAGTEELLGEQVWEGTGLPTGSARPLVWAHAEFLILNEAVTAGKVTDFPG